jgi:hypothetical protein
MEPSAMTLSALVSEIPFINIICRFGLFVRYLSGVDEIRVSNTFDGVVSCFDEFLYVSCRDSISLEYQRFVSISGFILLDVLEEEGLMQPYRLPFVLLQLLPSSSFGVCG